MADRFLGRTFGGLTTVALLGKGGMGRVYRATKEDGTELAVKVLPLDDGAARGTMAARFKREIKACLDLNHMHVIRLFDAGSEPEFDWFSMEVLDGETLQAKLKQRGKLPVPEALRIARELALALGYVHSRGVIHRDLKPGNVMIVRSGRTVLMDFGLAKLMDGTRITQTGHGLGTPRYMAPEMLLAKEPVPATDFYQLGVILYEMLSGQPVIKAKSFATLAHELTQVYPPPLIELDPGLPRELEPLVFNCLEKDPADRYPDATAFLDALDRFEKGEPVTRTGTFKTITLADGNAPTDERATTTVEARFRPLRVSGSTPAATGGLEPGVQAMAGETPFSFSFPRLVQPALDAARPRHAAALGVVLVLGAAALSWRAAHQVRDYRLRAPPAVAVSPLGAEIMFETLESLPGRIRLRREREGGPPGELDDKYKDFSAVDPAPGVAHRVVLDKLVAGRGYLARVLFPDGHEDHGVSLRVPEAPRIEGLRLRRGAEGGAVLGFGIGFPVGGKLSCRVGGQDRVVELGGERRAEWSLTVPDADPFAPVGDGILELRGAAGWEGRFGPYSFPGIDGELVTELQRFDPASQLARARQDATGPGGPAEAVRGLQKRAQELGVVEVLIRFAPHARALFGGPGRTPEARLQVLGALQRLAPVDFFCLSIGMPRMLEVERLHAEYAAVVGSMLYDRGPPPDLGKIAFPAPTLGAPQAFELGEPRPGWAECELELVGATAEDYLELDLNGVLTLLVPTLDVPGSAPPARLRRVCRLPPDALRAGQNTLLVRRGKLAPVASPIRLAGITVYHRSAGGP